MEPIIISRSDFAAFFCEPHGRSGAKLLRKLGPLQRVFESFVESELKIKAPPPSMLVELFQSCGDHTKSVKDLYNILCELSPGQSICARDVNALIDYLRMKVASKLSISKASANIERHDHAFGSGGDFIKTIHATTSACIVLAPIIKFCKTGTVNVTSHYGSTQAVHGMGYRENEFNIERVNHLLKSFGFAFVSLSALEFPYSLNLKTARKFLWDKSLNSINESTQNSGCSWREALQTVNIPIDIFKIVAPNAQVLNPQHHSTGVCHINMIPYVLSAYLHLNSEGVIVHNYDGIDEISNARVNSMTAKNLIIRIGREEVTIIEFSPEEVGVNSCEINDISESDDIDSEVSDFWQIISNKDKGAKKDFLVLNAAALLLASGVLDNNGDEILTSLEKGVIIAERLISTGRTFDNFSRLISSM